VPITAKGFSALLQTGSAVPGRGGTARLRSGSRRTASMRSVPHRAGLLSDVPTIFFITVVRRAPSLGRLRSAGALGVSLGKALQLGNLPSFWDGFRRSAALGSRVLLPSPSARRSRVARGATTAGRSPINTRAYGRGLRWYGCTTLSLTESHLARSSAAVPLQYRCLIASRQTLGCVFLLSQPATVSRVFY
jgi:hypothetical protein